MREWTTLRDPARRGTSAPSRRWIVAVGVGMIALGIGQALTRSKHPSPAVRAAPTASALRRWEVSLVDAHLLAAGAPLRSHGSAVLALPMSLWVLRIDRVDVQVGAGSVIDARGTARAGASSTIKDLRITLTARGRALLLRRALAHRTTLQLRTSLSGSAGSAMHSLPVTIRS